MKRIGYLYEKIISMDNLRLADEKARKGKKNTYGVRVFDRNREENLLKLHEMLKNKTFRTSKYDVFTIYEPKERVIYRLPYFPDRILHHAILNILEPIWRSIFTYNTYSCIKGRGIEGCARRVGEIIRRHPIDRPLYCLKIDIVKYYPSIDHEVMKRIIRRKIKDANVLNLLDEIIDSTDGLPIGNYSSQYLANLYLAYFMHWVNEVLKVESAEYADDITFFAENKEVLHKVRKAIKGKLEGELDYVGYQFFRKQKLMRKRTKQNLCREMKAARKKGIKEDALKMRISPWLGWTAHSDSRHLLEKIGAFHDIQNYNFKKIAI